MAGGGGGLQKPERVQRGKHSNRKKKKRIGFHLDMTPLVDITFLLLTFFMFTTTMLKPQVMDMRIPPEMFTDVQVKASNLLTLSLMADGRVLWYVGTIDQKKDQGNQPKYIALNKIRNLAFEECLKPNKKNELITVLRIDEKVKYQSVIAVLDELNLSESAIIQEFAKENLTRGRKFTISILTEKNIEDMNKAGGF